MKKPSCLVSLLLLFFLITGCAADATRALVLATTTSTEQTGLLADLLPIFTEETGIEVSVVAVGTGQALALGRSGEADVLLVHDTASEETFVLEGYAGQRHDVMYNQFVLVGPNEDPLQIRVAAPPGIEAAFLLLKDGSAPFVSRGDKSGTHQREISLWKAIAWEPVGDWYLSAGKGMGETLQMADELRAYTLVDEGTWLAMSAKLDMRIVVAEDPKLFNPYGILAVNPPAGSPGRHRDAERFLRWILSEKAQERIGEFGKDTYGKSLFVPNARN